MVCRNAPRARAGLCLGGPGAGIRARPARASRTRGSATVDGDGRARITYEPIEEDLDRLRDGIAKIARAYLAADAVEVFPPIQSAGPIRSEAQLAATLHAAVGPSALASLYAVHLFGGAAMGGNPESSACNEMGEVWDVRGLYVTDASALPTNTGVNPQITIMANSLRVAAGIEAPAKRTS